MQQAVCARWCEKHGHGPIQPCPDTGSCVDIGVETDVVIGVVDGRCVDIGIETDVGIGVVEAGVWLKS